jgi:cytochrome c556
MTTRTHALSWIVAGASLAFACSSPPPSPAPQAAPEPVVTTPAAPAAISPSVSINAMMVDLVDHAGHNLWEAERQGKAPKRDADWANVEEHAVQLVAAASAITVGGSGPNDTVWVGTPSWRVHAQKMADAAAEAVSAAQAKKLEALVAANGKLVESCEGCHKEFKPSLPSEGPVHRHED